MPRAGPERAEQVVLRLYAVRARPRIEKISIVRQYLPTPESTAPSLDSL